MRHVNLSTPLSASDSSVWRNRPAFRTDDFIAGATSKDRDSLTSMCIRFCDSPNVDRDILKSRILDEIGGDKDMSVIEAILVLEALQFMRFDTNLPAFVDDFLIHASTFDFLAGLVLSVKTKWLQTSG